MVSIFSLQQTGQMSGHMTSQSGNQDTILLVTILLGLIIIILLGTIIGILYLFYTGRLHFTKRIRDSNDSVSDSEASPKSLNQEGKFETPPIDLPPVNLNPLERKILEVVITGHNVLQSDLPDLVKSSKSKVSEALTNLEEKNLVQRFKSGRSLAVIYSYAPSK